MIAYKFLRAGRIGPFSGFQWPECGVWVRAEAGLAGCRTGIHACRLRDLPWWLANELWEIELEDDAATDEHKLIARGGCLRSRIEAWTPACADQYAKACAWRARDHAIEALRRHGHEKQAARMAGAGTLIELRDAAGELAELNPEARISLLMSQDGAACALTHAAPMGAYVAAHAAKRIGGPVAYDAERRWQSEWLARHLGLRPS
ncbi:MAG: hypothetical protein JO027_12640 [Solirubrobacterales bacterium]|nr:hypothetical protein [Solirubrobacterales bacterium]